jgi:dipeptidyl-peptidase-4
MNFKLKIFLLLLPVSLSILQAQPENLTEEDYERAWYFNNLRSQVYHLQVEPNWTEDPAGFWYVANTKEGNICWRVNLDELDKSEAFDREQLAQLLKDSLNINAKANDLPIQRIEWQSKGVITFHIGRKTFKADVNNSTLHELKRTSAGYNPLESTSPDGIWTAFNRDYNLHIRSVGNGEEFRLSENGKKDYEYASEYRWDDIIEGENGIRPERFRVNWSPDSKKILTNIVDLRKGRKMYLLDWSVDTLFRPRLLSYFRGSPGDTSLIYLRPVIFDVETKTEIPVDLEPFAHFNPIYLDWMSGGANLLGIYWERGYKTLRIVLIDPDTGKSRVIYSETSSTNIDSQFFTYRFTRDGKTLFFTSERSGWNQLYRLNLETGELSPLTEGEYFVTGIKAVDESNGMIYFTASGKNPKRNPYHEYFYRIETSGKGLKLLTPEHANHEVFLSPDREYFVDNYSTLNQPTISVLRNTRNGKVVLSLAEADAERLVKKDWKTPEEFTAVARDGKTEIYGALWKPTDFDPSKTYPVIDYSYTGPHTQVFPRSYVQGLNGTCQSLAELGFIVVRIDGLGSARRSKAFHNWSYKNMGKNLTDHVLAIKQLGQRFSWVDTNRVGIFGHSAGGYDAAQGLLRFPDFYKVGVASSADHDHRMEKAWWPEMYMGWPVDSAYHQQSNITMAPNLKGKLLITHGGIDENVNPSATFKLAEALIKAGKDFDMLILPSQRHGYRGVFREYFIRKRWDYFVQGLLGG